MFLANHFICNEEWKPLFILKRKILIPLKTCLTELAIHPTIFSRS